MSCCSSLASMISVPVPLPYMKPCRTSCNTMELQSRLLTIDVQTFQMVSTNHIPLYSPLPFGIRTMVVHIKASGMFPSQNATCMTLTALSHFLVSGSFFLVADRNHALRCSSLIPNGPPALSGRFFLAAAAMPPTSGGPSSVLTHCTNIGMLSPSVGRYL